MKVLVTGANGQLGSELRAIANQFKEFELLFTDVAELDICDKSAIDEYFKKNTIAYAVNCAAYTVVDKAEEDKTNAYKINVTAVDNLAKACKEFNTKLVHVSTDYVFNGFNHKPYVETDQTSPNSYYGETKLQGEQAFTQSGVEGIIVRTSWLYSAYGNNFVKTIMRLSEERDSLGVIFDQIGTPTWANDLAAAIMQALLFDSNSPDKKFSGIYHYSNEGVCSWYDFAKEIAAYAEHNCTINAIEGKDYPLPAPRPFYSVLNKAAIKSDFLITIPHWKESLHQCMDLLIEKK